MSCEAHRPCAMYIAQGPRTIEGVNKRRRWILNMPGMTRTTRPSRLRVEQAGGCAKKRVPKHKSWTLSSTKCFQSSRARGSSAFKGKYLADFFGGSGGVTNKLCQSTVSLLDSFEPRRWQGCTVANPRVRDRVLAYARRRRVLGAFPSPPSGTPAAGVPRGLEEHF